jgi:hypothetical protein
MKLHTGSHGQYEWLTSDDHELADWMRLCPETVFDKYIAVTSIDGAASQVTQEEKAAAGKRAKTSPIVHVFHPFQDCRRRTVMVGAAWALMNGTYLAHRLISASGRKEATFSKRHSSQVEWKFS